MYIADAVARLASLETQGVVDNIPKRLIFNNNGR